MPIELMASYGPSSTSRKSAWRTSTRSPSPRSATRLRARSAWGSERVTPTAWTPWCSAAWSTMPPHPQPTSSSRIPGCEVELAADELVLVRLCVLERGRVVVPDRARVRERRTEHHPVEVVRHVVVVRDGRGIAISGVAPAVEAGLFGRRRKRLQALPADELGRSHDLTRSEVQLLDVVGHREHVEDVAIDLELARRRRRGRTRARRARSRCGAAHPVSARRRWSARRRRRSVEPS